MYRTSPDFLEQKKANQAKWGSWQYNVRDELKPLTTDEIKSRLQQNKLQCAVLMQNIEGDFNFGTIVRSSNNFNVSEIFYYGNKRWDRRSSLGTHNYSPVIYLDTLDKVIELKRKYQFVAIENNIDGCIPINDFVYPARPAFIFGEENGGLAPDLLGLADFKVEIPSRGSVRSINVGSAASIVLFDYYSKVA